MFCLKVPTDPAWAPQAVDDIDALLVDHAHCEMKAASNALSLAARHPTRATLVQALTDLAREEIDHFQRVYAVIGQRGKPLGEPRVDAYAAELRKETSALPRIPAIPAIVDRLLVAAVIEARSCERFKLLIGELERRGETVLLAMYQELFPAEARHYRMFYDLAVQESSGDEEAVRSRLEAIADCESRIVATIASSSERATVHG